jgi:hypothetical protein
MEKELQIQVGDVTYTRVHVAAKMALATDGNTPEPVSRAAQASSKQLWWQDKSNPDLCHVRFILDAEGANANWDYMPRPQLIKGHQTAIFKPFDMDHIIQENGSMVYTAKGGPPVVNTIFGVMTHAALGHVDGTLLSDEELAELDTSDDMTRTDANKIAVVAWASLYSYLFPQTVAALTDCIDNDEMAVSMERWLSSYDYMIKEDGQYKAVAKAEAIDTGLDIKWGMRIRSEGSPIYRRALSYVYGGVAGTANPAQPLSKFVAPSAVKVAATNSESKKTILHEMLIHHGEVHRRFAVASREDQPGLITEHTKITRAIAALI